MYSTIQKCEVETTWGYKSLNVNNIMNWVHLNGTISEMDS